MIAGLTFKGRFPNSALDVPGVGAVHGRIGYDRRLDRDRVLFTDIEHPIRDYESNAGRAADPPLFEPRASSR